MKTHISAIDYFVPDEIITPDHMLAEIKSERFDIKHGLISKALGIKQMRYAASCVKPSHLAIEAAERLLTKVDLDRQRIDSVIFCGIDKDCVEPATACFVQAGLGIKKANSFDVGNACMGFMNGLQAADRMIKLGEAQNVLVCTGERPSNLARRLVPILKKEQDVNLFRQKLGAFTTGDAGAASLVTVSEDASGIEQMRFATHGQFAELCYYQYDKKGCPQGQMLMSEISEAMIKAHQELFAGCNSNIDCLVTHQVGKRPWTKFSSVFGVTKEAMTKTFDTLGNITSATFAINYAKALEEKRIKKGDQLFAAMAGSGLSVSQFEIVV